EFLIRFIIDTMSGTTEQTMTLFDVIIFSMTCPVTPTFVEQYKNDPRFSACVWSCSEAGFDATDGSFGEYSFSGKSGIAS
ncbi:hypothetical protein PZH42_29400, partial [Bacteroides cellulosilyticus]